MNFFKKNWILSIGLALLILGVGPLLIVILLSLIGILDNPNPIGLGLLAFITFWPSLILLLIGVTLLVIRHYKIKK